MKKYARFAVIKIVLILVVAIAGLTFVAHRTSTLMANKVAATTPSTSPTANAFPAVVKPITTSTPVEPK